MLSKIPARDTGSRVAARDTKMQWAQGRPSGSCRIRVTHKAQWSPGVPPRAQIEGRQVGESEQVPAGAGEPKGRLEPGQKGQKAG